MAQITTHHTPTDRFLGRCEPCNRPISTEVAGKLGDFFQVPCPDCGGVVTLERIYGAFNTMICDGRCEGAIGNVCVCSCGGRNHGGRFGIQQAPDVLARNIAKFRSTTVKRQQSAADRKALKAAQKAAEEAQEQEAYESDNAGTLAALAAYSGPNEFLCSIRDQASYKRLSARQLEAAESVLTREAEWAAKREAQKAADAVNAKPIPTGRQVIEGVVLSVREQDSDFGVTWKMLVRADGWKVWGTVPSDLSRQLGYIGLEALKGRKVRLTATIQASQDDPSFGFYSRPSKPQLLEEVGL